MKKAVEKRTSHRLVKQAQFLIGLTLGPLVTFERTWPLFEPILSVDRSASGEGGVRILCISAGQDHAMPPSTLCFSVDKYCSLMDCEGLAKSLDLPQEYTATYTHLGRRLWHVLEHCIPSGHAEKVWRLESGLFPPISFEP